VQFELARELGFASWPKLKAYIERLALEQPFRVDLDYYEGRASGIASVNSVSVAEARRDLAARHGFSSWSELRRHLEAMHSGEEPPTPFVLAYQAVEANDRARLVQLLDRFPDLVVQCGTSGNDLLGMAGTTGSCRSCWSAAPTRIAGTTTGGRSCTRPAMGTTASSPD
jgi:plasmid stability protein